MIEEVKLYVVSLVCHKRPHDDKARSKIWFPIDRYVVVHHRSTVIVIDVGYDVIAVVTYCPHF